MVEYRYFDCGWSSCTTHTDRCSQNEYADQWKKFNLLPRKKIDLSSDNSDWFKPVEIKDMPSNNEFMHYEEDLEEDLEDAVHCDVIEESEEENKTQRNESEDNKPEHDVTRPEVQKELVEDRDVIAEGNKTEHDVIEDNKPERDVTRPEVQKELVEDRDVIAEENESDESEDSVVALFTVPYESSDFSSDEDSPPNYPTEIPPLLKEEDENMNFDWKGILSDLKTYDTFSALKQYISRTTLPEVRPIIKYLVEENDVVDSIAAEFFPRDGPKGYIPIETMGDGNCGYWALAHVLLSDEGRYQEVRACITFEAVLKEDSFLMHDILAREHLEGSKNRPAAYASYSGLLTPEITTLNKQSIRTVIKANARDFTFMGVWQLHHAVEAFRHPIISVYPWYTNRDIQKDINRVVLPINSLNDNKQPVHIMWTPLSRNDKHCDVKHFVALLVIYMSISLLCTKINPNINTLYLKLCLIIVLAFFYYNSLTNEDDDYENDDDDQSDVTKSENPKKHDVTKSENLMKRDVTKSENPKKHHVTQGKKRRKKGDGEPTDNKCDESMESMASNDKKHDVNQPTDDSNKKHDVNKGKKRKHDVSMENSEPTDNKCDESMESRLAMIKSMMLIKEKRENMMQAWKIVSQQMTMVRQY